MAGTRCLHPGARGCDGQYQARRHGRFFADKVFSVRQKCFCGEAFFHQNIWMILAIFKNYQEKRSAILLREVLYRVWALYWPGKTITDEEDIPGPAGSQEGTKRFKTIYTSRPVRAVIRVIAVTDQESTVQVPL